MPRVPCTRRYDEVSAQTSQVTNNQHALLAHLRRLSTAQYRFSLRDVPIIVQCSVKHAPLSSYDYLPQPECASTFIMGLLGDLSPQGGVAVSRIPNPGEEIQR
jgi:hypothetical protein